MGALLEVEIPEIERAVFCRGCKRAYLGFARAGEEVDTCPRCDPSKRLESD